jgi:RES domain-containing protein
MSAAWPRAEPLAEDLYRVAGPRHTTAMEIVSGIGAFFSGGRWNPKHVMKVVYLSKTPETATYEANEHFRHYRLPLTDGLPKVQVAVRVEVGRILDLTKRSITRSLPEPMKSLLAEDWRAIMARGDESTTQALGRAAFHAGLQGLVVKSKPDTRGKNVLIFPESLTTQDVLSVLNPDLLDGLGKPV